MNSVCHVEMKIVVNCQRMLSHKRKQSIPGLTQPLATAPHRPQPHGDSEADTGPDSFKYFSDGLGNMIFLPENLFFGSKYQPYGAESPFLIWLCVFLNQWEFLENPTFISVQVCVRDSVCVYVCVCVGGELWEGMGEGNGYIYIYPRANF